MIEVVEMGRELGLMQLRAVEALGSADTVVLQTTQAPVAEEIAVRARAVESLDPLFEQAEDFASLYARGAEQILAAPGKVVFCCLGAPADNGFVAALKEHTEVLFLGGGDPVREALTLAGGGLPAASYTVADARTLSTSPIATDRTLVVTGIDDPYQAAAVKLTLTEYYPEQLEVTLVMETGVEHMTLRELDLRRSWGSGAVLVVRPLDLLEKERFTYYDLVEIMKRLRAPDGCPWDGEQTHRSLTPYLIEEAYETAQAVADGDMPALCDELGDVLLQVIFHAEIGRLAGEFGEMDVTTAESAKMIRRHPHVFGEVQVSGSGDVLRNWDAIKRDEKGGQTRTQALLDVPAAAGALIRAEKIQKKAAGAGFDWPDWQGALRKVREELAEFQEALESGNEMHSREEGGDLLFAAVNLLRLAGINPETALSEACSKFIRRFAYMEAHAGRDLASLSLRELDGLWDDAKADGC